MTLVFTDRYQALGIPYPDPSTMCRSKCEGTGIVPVPKNARGRWRVLWLAAEQREHAADGWHFVRCPDCGGSGIRRKK